MDKHIEDDIDDIMASIMGGESVKPSQQPQKQMAAPVKKDPPPKAKPVEHKPKPKKEKKKRERSGKKILWVLLVLLLSGLAFSLYKVRQSSNGTAAESPFTSEVAGNTDFPLYYPTQLPPGYSINKEALQEPKEDVIIFPISNQEGKIIQVTIQKKPETFKAEVLDSQLSDTREIQTKLGTAKVGTTVDGRFMGYIVTDQTLIIVNSPKDIVSQEDFDKLLSSFVES